MIVFGIFVPLIPIAFFIPHLRRFITSALPSTTIIDPVTATSGPAGNSSDPNLDTSAGLTESEIS